MKLRLLFGLANCGGIRQIEELRSEMQIARFNQRKHSLHGHIHVVLAGSAHNAHSAIAEARIARPASIRSLGRYRKCVLVR